MRKWRARLLAPVAITVAAMASAAGQPPSTAVADGIPDIDRVAAGGVYRISIPEAFGGKTVIGQLTVARALGAGFVTAYGCDDGIPADAAGNPSRSDLNYDGRVSHVASNRLIVEADDDGDVCFYTLRPAAIIVDVNGVTFDTGINSFPNRRTDTRLPGASGLVAAGGVLRVAVPEATGHRTVVGQLTVDRATAPGFVTAYGCDDGVPPGAGDDVGRSDLNYDSNVSRTASNRLVVQADADGEVCFLTSAAAALVVDVNGVADEGIGSFANIRTDTRRWDGQVGGQASFSSGQVLRVTVPEAAGGKTVIGQLTVARAADPGFVTSYGCDSGIPTDPAGNPTRSDVNFDGHVTPVASNRLIVEADADGDICFQASAPVAMVVDVNAASAVGISSFPNRRFDTRVTGADPGAIGSVDPDGVPVWPPYDPKPAISAVAALTGLPAGDEVRNRPILAVKIDNYGPARPQWGLDAADAVIEENVEGISRFVALFHSRLPSVVGPVRSARTGDLDLLAGMNRPVFAYSGANDGVMAWIDSATSSGMLVEHSAQRHGCYSRSPERPGPHNLLLDPTCATTAAAASAPGAAQPLWSIDAAWEPPGDAAITSDTAFAVDMDGVDVGWTWDPATGVYVRAQDGTPHLAAGPTADEPGPPLVASNVVVLGVAHVTSPVDARSPHPITVGTGGAVVHRDGRAIPAVWSRAEATDPFEFYDPISGAPIPLDTGTTFVELTRAG